MLFKTVRFVINIHSTHHKIASFRFRLVYFPQITMRNQFYNFYISFPVLYIINTFMSKHKTPEPRTIYGASFSQLTCGVYMRGSRRHTMIQKIAQRPNSKKSYKIYLCYVIQYKIRNFRWTKKVMGRRLSAQSKPKYKDKIMLKHHHTFNLTILSIHLLQYEINFCSCWVKTVILFI